MFAKKFLLMSAFVLVPWGAQAEELNYNIVSLSASAHERVAQDLMTVQLLIEERDRDRSKAANRATERSNRVIQAGREHEALRVQISGRHSFPEYSRRNSSSAAREKPIWHDVINIEVESRDFELLNRFVAQVQDDASISNLSFSVANETRRALQEKLILAALEDFRHQAESISHALGGDGYIVVDLNIGNPSEYEARNAYPMAMARGYDEAASLAKSAEVMETEVGEQEIHLSVRGRIQVE